MIRDQHAMSAAWCSVRPITDDHQVRGRQHHALLRQDGKVVLANRQKKSGRHHVTGGRRDDTRARYRHVGKVQRAVQGVR